MASGLSLKGDLKTSSTAVTDTRIIANKNTIMNKYINAVSVIGSGKKALQTYHHRRPRDHQPGSQTSRHIHASHRETMVKVNSIDANSYATIRAPPSLCAYNQPGLPYNIHGNAMQKLDGSPSPLLPFLPQPARRIFSSSSPAGRFKSESGLNQA